MKILAVGAFSIPYIRDNWQDALKHLGRAGGLTLDDYGDMSEPPQRGSPSIATLVQPEVLCVNAYPLIALRGGPYCNKYIYQLVKRHRFDYLFFYHDWIFEHFGNDFYSALRQADVTRIVYYPDDEPGRWLDQNLRHDHHFDIIASHSSAAIEQRRAKWGDRAIYVPWGFNPRFVDRPKEAVAKTYDVVFVGKNKVFDRRGGYREDGFERQRALSALAEAADTNGWRFKLFGHGWDRHPTLARYDGGVLNDAQMRRVYAESRIVFNPAWSWSETQASSGLVGGSAQPQTKFRHFEVPGYGAFQVTNHNPELAQLLEPGQEIVFFETPDDLVQKVTHYLHREDEREAVAEAAYRRVHREHTLDTRLQDLFARVADIAPPRPQSTVTKPAQPAVVVSGRVGKSVPALGTSQLGRERYTFDEIGQPRVKRIPVDSLGQLETLVERLRTDTALLSNADWLHLVDKKACHTHSDYTGLVPIIENLRGETPTAPLGLRSFVQLLVELENPIQPTLTDLHGDILEEVSSWERLDAATSELVRSQMTFVDDTWRFYPLCNYLFPANRAVELLSELHRGDAAQLRKLNPFNTAVMVNEVGLSTGDLDKDKSRSSHPALRKLRPLLRKLERENARVVVYAARGLLAEQVFQAIDETQVRLVGIVDNALSGSTLQGVPVRGVFDLPDFGADVIFIAAAYSGPGIHAGIRSIEAQATLVPLYDLDDPVWRVLLP